VIFASAIAVLFGAYEQDGAHFIFSIPEVGYPLRSPDSAVGLAMRRVRP